MSQITPCPCQSGQPFPQCCAPFLEGKHLPDTAEQLMRSRYTAYVQHNAAYLLATWHPDTRPPSLTFNEHPLPKWIGLTIHRHTRCNENEAEVEFTARYRINGRGYRQHENSRFIRESGKWFYIDGDSKT